MDLMTYLNVFLLNASNLLGETGVEGMGYTALILSLKFMEKFEFTSDTPSPLNEEDLIHHSKNFIVI